ncbi:MAG TPA: glycosyltransferase 87 family protein [Gemmatimonadaceae bacterium]|nr:glycosyltransferase 87 family protein [Gemmatimonadaceae bacterium]
MIPGPRRLRLALLLVFVASRAITAWWADHPERYGSPRFSVVTDVTLYESWARAMVLRGMAPYADFAIEYPPGVVPFVVAPQLVSSDSSSYRSRFILLMLLVDTAGAIGLGLIARRGGSVAGLWLWTIALPLLGPLVYARLDLVVATATIWALASAAHGRWIGAGAWLGFGAMVKVYPALLMPLAFVQSPERRRLVIGASVAVVLSLAIVVGAFVPLFRQVVVYHTARGVSFESTWGALLLLSSKFGHEVRYQFDYGALLVQGGGAALLKRIGTLLMLAAVAAGTLLMRRTARGDARILASGSFGTLATVVGVASVFSPQFVIWLIALGAAALCFRGQAARDVVLLVIPIAAISQLLYPFLYGQLIARDFAALSLLVLRNSMILGAGVAALVLTRRQAIASVPDAG